jgi:hypothetical protein
MKPDERPAARLPSRGGEPSAGTSFLHDVFLVLAVAWATRILFMLVVPPEARSVDAHSWETVAGILNSGGNPYRETSLLNWPPLWMQLIYFLSKTAAIFGIPFFRALQIFLVLIESLVMVGVIKMIREIAPAANAGKIVLIGLALNPVAILLVCQHGNFDVLVALWLLLFIASLLRYGRHREATGWLAACLFLGLGILTKTVPLVLVPLLAGGFRQVTSSVKFLGLALLFGPVALGMSIIYVLAPADVTAKVLAYQSSGGFFGISGLLHLAGVDSLAAFFGMLFCLLLITVMVLSSIRFWRQPTMGGRETILFAALLLATIPALGPGYGPQYIFWFLPLLIISFATGGRRWQWILVFFGLTSAGTYLFEYALFPSHGMFLFNLLTHAQMASQAQAILDWGQKWSTQTGQTLVRLPLFIAYLVLLGTGTNLLFQSLNSQARTVCSGSKESQNQERQHTP